MKYHRQPVIGGSRGSREVNIEHGSRPTIGSDYDAPALAGAPAAR